MAKKLKLYHATNSDNIPRITMEGLISKYEGVYLTDSAESAARWIGFRLKAMGVKYMSVVEVEISDTHLIEGTDHSPVMVQLFGVGKSILSTKPIPAKNITSIINYELNPNA